MVTKKSVRKGEINVLLAFHSRSTFVVCTACDPTKNARTRLRVASESIRDVDVPSPRSAVTLMSRWSSHQLAAKAATNNGAIHAAHTHAYVFPVRIQSGLILSSFAFFTCCWWLFIAQTSLVFTRKFLALLSKHIHSLSFIPLYSFWVVEIMPLSLSLSLDKRELNEQRIPIALIGPSPQTYLRCWAWSSFTHSSLYSLVDTTLCSSLNDKAINLLTQCEYQIYN